MRLLYALSNFIVSLEWVFFHCTLICNLKLINSSLIRLINMNLKIHTWLLYPFTYIWIWVLKRIVHIYYIYFKGLPLNPPPLEKSQRKHKSRRIIILPCRPKICNILVLHYSLKILPWDFVPLFIPLKTKRAPQMYI